MSFEAFGDVHEVAAVEIKRASLFKLGEDICRHNFSWAVKYCQVTASSLDADEKVPG